jgi:hypothetical protein
MPKLVFARLADETHRMPHPIRPAMDFPADGQTVDREDPVWLQLINDGSLVVDEDNKPAADPAAAKRKEKN